MKKFLVLDVDLIHNSNLLEGEDGDLEFWNHKFSLLFKSLLMLVFLLLFNNSILLSQVNIISNTNWNSSNLPPSNVSSGIVISNGAILTIDGITITFNAGAQVMVQSGSKMSCNTVVFKSTSQNSPWNGITLNGNSSLSQFTTSPNLTVISNQNTWSGVLNQSQTYCLMLNCTLENVIKAVRVVDGAIFRVRNSTFKEFVFGVSIEAYTSQNFPSYNACYIMDCNFIWQVESTATAFTTVKEKITGIEIVDADGLNIGGCNFECNYPKQNRDILERGTGISAVHSNLNISQSGDVWCFDEEGCLNNCSSSSQPKLNYFKNLSNGIVYNGLNDNIPVNTDKKTISIRNSQFTNVLFDIHITKSIQPIVAKIYSGASRTELIKLFSNFCDNSNTPPICTRKQILNISNCEGLNVYKNNFYFDGLGCLFAVINNCGKTASSFINNTFTENSGSAVATNSVIGEEVYGLCLTGDCEGLNVHCNDFEDMGADIYLEDDAIFWKNSSTGNYILGTETEAGNNKFSNLIQGRENILISLDNNCPSVLKYNYYTFNSLDNFIYNNSTISKVLNNLSKTSVSDPPNCSSPCPKLFQSLSTTKLSKNADYQIYPNPAENEILIQNISAKDCINVYDISGQLILTKQNIQNNLLDISMLKPGMYFIKIIGISSSKKLKFVKI